MNTARAITHLLKSLFLLTCVSVFAFGCICFGYKLERAAAHYAHGQRMETLKSLYGSTDWSAKIEKEYRLRLATEERLRVVCKKVKTKVCL